MIWWKTNELDKKNLMFGNHPRTSFACVTTDDEGTAYGGGSNSLIYVVKGNTIKQTLEFHSNGFVGAINWVNGQLFTGGKDGKVLIIDTSTMQCTGGFQVDALPRAIDSFLGKIVVGLRNGNIEEFDIASGEQKKIH